MKKASKAGAKKKPPQKQRPLSTASNQVNWIYFIMGIVTGFFGSKFWAGENPRWLLGLPLQAIAAWSFWKAFPKKFPAFSNPKEVSLSRKSLPPRSLNLLFFFLILISALLGQYFFFSKNLTGGLICWAVAFIPACFLFTTTPESTYSTTSFPRLEKMSLILILVLASLMRFPFIAQHVVGLQIDEANNILDSYSVINGSFRSPFLFGWGGNESLPFFTYALAFKIFGQNFAVARAFSSLISIAALYFFYSWCRLFFSSKASLAATFLLSVSWWYLYYSLSPFHDMLVVFFEILSFYFLERCLRYGSKVDFALLGIFLALGVLGYLPARLVPVMVALVVLVFALWNRESFLKTYFNRFLLTAFFFLLLVGPFILNVVSNPAEFLGRSKELSLLNEVHRTGHYDLIFKRFFWTFTSFVYPAESYDQRFGLDNTPELDPLTGFLLYFGLFLTLLKPGKMLSWLAIIGFALGSVANAFAIQGPNPEPFYINPMRFFLIIPFLFFMGARTIDWIFNLFARTGKKTKLLLNFVLMVALIFSIFWNSRVFYVQFHKDQSGWAGRGFNHIKVADFLNANYPRCHILLDPEYDSSTVRILTQDKVKYLSTSSFQLPLNYKIDKNVMIVFKPGDFDENRIRQTYPNAIWGEVKDDWNDVVVKTVEISKADIEALQNGNPSATALP